MAIMENERKKEKEERKEEKSKIQMTFLKSISSERRPF